MVSFLDQRYVGAGRKCIYTLQKKRVVNLSRLSVMYSSLAQSASPATSAITPDDRRDRQGRRNANQGCPILRQSWSD